MDTFRALAKPEGLKFTPLFVGQVDDGPRMARIEDAVQTLRNDLDTLVPSMVRLVAIEKDMKELVAQLKTLTGEAPPMDAVEMLPVEQADITNTNSEIPGEDVVRGTEPANEAVDQAAEAGDTTTSTSSVTPEAAPQGMPPEGAASPIPPSANDAQKAQGPALPTPPPVPPSRVPEEAPAAKPAAPASEPPKPAANEAPISGEARDIRIGDHPDKTRIVIDLSNAAAINAILANDGTQVVIDLRGMKWAAKDSSGGNVSALIAGWAVEGGKVLIDLLGPSTIRKQEILAPQGGVGNYRLIIDLHSEALHN